MTFKKNMAICPLCTSFNTWSTDNQPLDHSANLGFDTKIYLIMRCECGHEFQTIGEITIPRIEEKNPTEQKKLSLLDKIKIELEKDAIEEQKTEEKIANLKKKLYNDLDLLKKELPMFRINVNNRCGWSSKWFIELNGLACFTYDTDGYELYEIIQLPSTLNIVTRNPYKFNTMEEFINSPEFINVVKHAIKNDYAIL